MKYDWSNKAHWQEKAKEVLAEFEVDALTKREGDDVRLGWAIAFELEKAFLAGEAKAVEAAEELRAFKQEWEEKDGNSPGYNLQKARNYGRQACNFRRLYEAYKKASDAMSCLRIAYLSAGDGYHMAGKLLQEARDLEVELLGERKPSELPPLWGKSPVEELATEQLMQEVLRRIRESGL